MVMAVILVILLYDTGEDCSDDIDYLISGALRVSVALVSERKNASLIERP